MSRNEAPVQKKTHPLLQPLYTRVKAWREEVGLKCHPRLPERLQDALDVATEAGLESDLVLFLVAICEWWFRVYRPTEAHLQKALQARIEARAYTPQAPWPTFTPDVPAVVDRYLDAQIVVWWDPASFSDVSWDVTKSVEPSRSLRESLKVNREELVQKFCQWFLVSENRTLPPRSGGYRQWGPWVAAIAAYTAARSKHHKNQDSEPLRVAESIILALNGTEPDKSSFHHKRHEVKKLAPDLISLPAERDDPEGKKTEVKSLMNLFKKAKSRDVQAPVVQPLIDADCFPSLRETGGWKLLTGKSFNPSNWYP